MPGTVISTLLIFTQRIISTTLSGIFIYLILKGLKHREVSNLPNITLLVDNKDII